MSARTLWRVVAPHFVAGLVTDGDRVVEAAPILRWTMGRSRPQLRERFSRLHYEVQRVGMDPRGTTSGA